MQDREWNVYSEIRNINVNIFGVWRAEPIVSAFCYADINWFVYNVCARKADVEGKRVESRDLIGYNSRHKREIIDVK